MNNGIKKGGDGNGIEETLLWGADSSSSYGSRELSLTFSGYDYLKLWCGGNYNGTAFSKPVILPCNETNKYKVGCVNLNGEIANVTVTNTRLSYYSEAVNYQKITGVVGIKVKK